MLTAELELDVLFVTYDSLAQQPVYTDSAVRISQRWRLVRDYLT